MADIQANIGIGVDTSQALAQIRQLQREISAFHTSMAKGGALANAESARLSQNLINSINSGGKFAAGMTQISSSTESFTNALEKNKLSMTQYFRYAGGASKSFGKMFSREFNTINRVATERVKDLQTQYISMGRDANGALQSIKVRPLALDMENLGTRVQMVAQKQQIFNQLLKQGSTNLLNFGKNTQWAGRQLMVGFTIPLTIFGATAAREFQKLEEQAVKFRRVYGDMFTTDAETEQALQNIRDLAEEFTKYGIAVEKTVGLAAKVAQMGNVGEDLTAQVTQATRLAVLGGLEQEEALDTTISLTNAFGIAAEDLAGKIAFLNAAENQTILAIEDFNEAIPKAGSVVQQLGGDVEDLAFMLTAMREGGVNASQAANAIKSSLGRMINPTEAAKEKLAGFGIDIMGIVENNAGNLQATIMQLGYALEALDPLERARAIETLFGKFQFARMSTMFQNIVKDGSQANKVLQLTTNSTEELAIIAERELKRVEDSVGFKFQKQLEKLQAALAPIGEEFLKAITPVVEFGTKLLKAFNNLGEGGKQFAVILTAIAGVIAPAALMTFGLIANGVANLIKFFALLGKGFGMLSGQSRILGTGTEYMTQQQIEAAAVAASLGQSHTNLIQVFTAEATAVRNLANAYREAVIAQGAFTGTGAAAAASTIPKAKGFASGGMVRGPGTGTSDSIPAMLSDGEFVVSAQRTEEYLPLLNLIAEGKVPRYASVATGGSVVGADRFSASGPMAVEASHTAERTPKALLDTVQRWIEAINRGRQAAEGYADGLLEAQREIYSIEATGADGKYAVSRNAGTLSTAVGMGFPEAVVGGETYGGTTITGPRERNRALNVTAPGGGQVFEGIPESLSDVILAGERAQQALDSQSEESRRYAGALQELVAEGQRAKAVLSNSSSESEAQIAYKRDLNKQLLKERIMAQTTATESEAVAAAEARLAQADQDLARARAAGMDEAQQVEQADALYGLATMDAIEVRRSNGTVDSLPATAIAAGPEGTGRGILRQVGQGRGSSSLIDPLTGARATRGNDLLPKRYVTAARVMEKKSKDGLESAMASPVGSSIKAAQASAIKTGEAYNDGLEATVKDPKDVASEKAGRNSPHPEAFPDGVDDARDYLRGQESVLSADADPYAGSNLAAPKPPQVAYSASDPSQPGGIRGKLRNIGNRAADKFNDSAIGQGIGRKFADMTGTPLADSQGNLVYDPNAIASSGAPMPVRIVEGFEMSPEFQDVMETGNINSENLADTLERQQKTTEQNTQSQKEVIRTDKAQRRQQRAGRMLGAAGAVTMAAGMASQVEGPVGEVARAVMPVAAGFTAIGPLLTALPAPLAALVAVAGALVGGFFMLKNHLEKVRKEAFELARSLGVGSEAMQKFADYAGTVASSEIMDKRRENRLAPMQVQPGKATFGQGFVGSEEGQALVESVRKGINKLGTDGATRALFLQLGTAVSQGILSAEQARSIAGAIAIEVGNLDLGIQLNSQLLSLLGPNGENLLVDPLSISIKLAGEVQKDIDASLAEFQNVNEILGGGGMLAGYLGTTAAMSDEGKALVEEERQRQIDAAEGFWSKLWAEVKPTGAILSDIRESNLGNLSGSLISAFENVESLLDTAMVASEDRINQAIEEGKTFEEIQAIRQQEADAIREHTAALSQANQDILDAFMGIDVIQRNALLRDQTERIVSQAPEEERAGLRKGMTALADTAQFSQEQRFVIQAAVEAGDINAQTLLDLVENPQNVPVVVDLIGKVGSGEAAQILQIAQAIEDEDLRGKFILSFEDEDPNGVFEKIKEFEYLTRTSALFEGIDIPISYFENNPAALDNLMLNADKFRAMSNGQDGLNMDTYANVYGAELATQLQESILANQEEFDKIPKEQQIEYGILFALQAQLSASPEAQAILGNLFPEMTGAAAQGKNVLRVLPSLRDTTTAVGADDGLDTGGGGGAQEGFDDLLVGLRNVRQATIDMKRGWDGMQESLQKFLDSGANGFNGLANQMRRVGVGESLIERITGMDPDEYEKRKAELFVFDEAGNIVGTTQKLQNMGAAMNKLALGDYVNQQQAFIENTNNQFTAMNKLTAAGLSFVDAYEMVQDQALATAIAMSASSAEVKELIRITEKMNEMRSRYDRLSEEQQAAKAVRQTNQEFNNRVAVLNKLAQQQGKYTDEEINAILNDSNLSTLFLNPKIDAKTLKKALENARRAADLELRIKVATEEGKAGLAQELMAGVQDEFSRQETKIELAVGLATKDDQKIVDEAQNTIAAIQYQIDDYEAQLKGIEDQEEVINEKYDERFKALDEVAKANERINQAQQAQLDIADALSRGDIAAAARAQQQLRSQQAQSAEEARRESLQKQQAAEIAAIRSQSGMSREQIEDKVKSLQDEIFGIEESQLEPAQERIRIAEYNKQLQIDALEVSGKTRDEWSQIANLTDIATQNTEEFALNVERALALYEHLVNGAALDTSLFGGDMDARLEAMGINIKEERAVSAAIAAANNIDTSGPVTTKQEKMKDLADQLKALDIQLKETAGYTDGRSRADIIAQQRDISKQFAELALGADAIKMGAISINQLENAWAQAGRTVINTPPPSSNNRRPSNSSSNRTTQIITPTVVPKNASPAVQSAIRKENAAINRINQGGPIGGLAMGGLFRGFGMGGKVKGYAAGGFRPLGSDIINARLTPGEFVIKRPAVNKFGVDNLEKINNGTYSGGSVYNYNLAVNVKSDSNPDQIANTVIRSIKRIDSQRIRGNRL